MLKLALLTISLGAGCATTGLPSGGEREAAPRTGIQLELAGSTDLAAPVFPAAVDPKVPSVDRMAHALRARYGATEMTAALDLCVAPDGHVTKLGLAKSSTYEPFDNALLADAADWKFAALPGPATVESCRRATIAYHAR